jgi:hypothetical protein
VHTDNKIFKVLIDSCGESTNIPSGNTVADKIQTRSNVQLRMLVCFKIGMLLYVVSDVDS